MGYSIDTYGANPTIEAMCQTVKDVAEKAAHTSFAIFYPIVYRKIDGAHYIKVNISPSGNEYVHIGVRDEGSFINLLKNKSLADPIEKTG